MAFVVFLMYALELCGTIYGRHRIMWCEMFFTGDSINLVVSFWFSRFRWGYMEN